MSSISLLEPLAALSRGAEALELKPSGSGQMKKAQSRREARSSWGTPNLPRKGGVII